MEVRRARTVAEFKALAGDFLAAREAEHNLMFGICSHIESDPTQYPEQPYFGAVLDGGRVVGAALRTPPWRLAVSMMDHPGSAEALAVDLAGGSLPGVVGPAESAGTFAAAWSRTAGVAPRVTRHERAFQLMAVRPPRLAPGSMVRAGEPDRTILRAWFQAFHEEAMDDAPPQDYGAMTDRWIRRLGRTAYLWVDEGRPVSLAGAGGLTPNGIRVGPVYTPPDLRGRGYASNLVAGVTQLQLDEGRRFVFLFTDLANPTANKIYQDIGYEPVIDIDEYAFEAT